MKFKKLKNASTYLIELIIVVVGVSIAFQLNVWKEDSKEKKFEKQLLLNFKAENAMNIREMDSSAINKQNSIKETLKLINLLQEDNSNSDSIRYSLANLYEISWPNNSTTHLDNYLSYTLDPSVLREEMLSLKSLYRSSDALSEKYVELKQDKFIDYLSDATDMTSNLEFVNEEKIRSVQFRNHLMFIAAYEESLFSILNDIDRSQHKIDSLLNISFSN